MTLAVILPALLFGQLLLFLFFPQSLPALLWYCVNATETLTGISLRWTETIDSHTCETDGSGEDDSARCTSSERALLLNCAKGRVSCIVVKKWHLSSLWDLLVLWKCRICVHNVQITLRGKTKSSGKRKSFSSVIVRKLLQGPRLWRWVLRGVALVAPDTVLDASVISLNDPNAHTEVTVDRATAELIGRRIHSMTAGAVVSGLSVKDTSADCSQHLVSIESICMQWNTEPSLRVVQKCSVVLGKIQIGLNAPALLEQLARKPQGGKKGKLKTKGMHSGTQPPDPVEAVSAALAYFPVLPETLELFCTSVELSAPLGGQRAVAPGVKPARKRRHALMHVGLSPADGAAWSQEATIPYLCTCMRLIRLRETLSGKPGQSSGTSSSSATDATEPPFGQQAGLTIRLAACNAASRAQAASAVAAGVSDALNTAMQAPGDAQQSSGADRPASDLLVSIGGGQVSHSLSTLPQSSTVAPQAATEAHGPGVSAPQLSQHSDVLGSSGTATGVTEGTNDDTSGKINETAPEAVDSPAKGSDSGRVSAMSAVPGVLDPSPLRSTSNPVVSGMSPGVGGTGDLVSTQTASAGDSMGQFVDATEGSVHGGPDPAEAPAALAAVSPRGRRRNRRSEPQRRTVSVSVSTGALAVWALGGSLSVFNGASRGTLLLEGPAGGRSRGVQALSVALGLKDLHVACLCASLWSFEETHHVLQTLSKPLGSQHAAPLSPASQARNATAGDPSGGAGTAAGSTERSAAVPEHVNAAPSDPLTRSAPHKSSLPVCATSSPAAVEPDGSSSGAQAPAQELQEAPEALKAVAQALKATSWQLNVQLEDEASLLVVDGGSKDAEKMFGKPDGPKCKTLVMQCGRTVAAVGAAPDGSVLAVDTTGGEKGSMHAMSSPFVSSKLPAQATRYQVPSTLLNPKQQPLVERQSDAAASPEALASSGGGQVAVVVKCQDAWTAFVTSFANERLGLAAAHDPLWEELLQTVQPADRWDVEHLTEGPEGGLSGAALLHLLQQQNVLQHAASWSHVSVDMSCGSIGQEFAGPYNVSTAASLEGLCVDLSPHQLMTAMDAASSLKQMMQHFIPRSDSMKASNSTKAPGSVRRGIEKRNIATFNLHTQLTDCQATWSQLVTQQPSGSSLSASTGSQSAPNTSQMASASSAMNSSNKSGLSTSASSAESRSSDPSTVQFLYLHDSWTLASFTLAGAYTGGIADGSASIQGASWGCQWQDLRGGRRQNLGNVYSVSSARLLPPGPCMDPWELHRSLSPELDVCPELCDLAASAAVPCAFVARRKQRVSADELFQDAPAVTHVPALRLHPALAPADACRVCHIGSVLAQAVSLKLDEPWNPDAPPPSTPSNEGLTVNFEGCSADGDIDTVLVHLAAAQHATVLAQWVPKLLKKKQPQAAVPCESDVASKQQPLAASGGTPSAASALLTSAISTHSSTISAVHDGQNASASAEPLSRMFSVQTAASLTPAPSGTAKAPKHALHRILKQCKVLLKSVSASCAIGGRDTLSFQCDAWVTDAGESCQFQHLTVFMNGCPVVEVLDVGARINVTREEVTGVDDLKAEVKRLSLHFSGQAVVLCVPHSQDPGRLYAFSRLWAKPLSQVVLAHVHDLKEAITCAKALLKPQAISQDASNTRLGVTAAPSASDVADPQPSAALPIDEGLKRPKAQLGIKLSCDISEMAMRIEHHTLERKLCLLYPVHKRTAALQTALSAAMGTYAGMHDTSLARASAKRSEKSDKSTVQEAELPADIEDRLSRNLVAHDMYQCMDTLAVANTSRVDQPGHLFNIACNNVCGSITVDGKDAVSFAAAVSTVYALLFLDTTDVLQGLDRATQGLTISDAQRMQVDMHTGALALRFGTMQNPMLEATSLAVSGPVVMARLASLPPQTDKITVPVGAWHSVTVPVARSGCRPPPKAYTDLKVALGGFNFQMTAGLEPAFAAMSQSTKRIIPPSRILGDATVPPPDPNDAPVAWWDRMRYMWRGRMRCTISDACFTVSTAHAPDADATTQRMDFRAKVFDLSLDPDAQLSLALESTTSTLLTQHHEGRSRPDAPMLRVPLFSLSNTTITNNLTIELPNGRALSAHHIFPAISLGQRVHAEGVQGPVDVSSVLAAQSIAANVNISIRSLALPGMGDNQAIPLAQAGVVYYSEEMMAFIRDLQAAFGSPARYLRQASKRSEDFWHKRTHKPAGGPKMSLGELFRYMNLNIRGVDCAFQHHAVSSGDLGEVHARPEDINVECRWTFTSSNTHTQAETVGSADIDFVLNSAHSLRLPSIFAYARGPSVKSTMSSLSVSATNVRLLRLEMTPATASKLGGLDDIGTFHQVHAHSDEHEGSMSGASDSTGQCKAHGWEDMGSIRSLSVFQAPAPPSTTDEKRPIIVVSESAHLIITETSRQALGSVLIHCKAPFGPKGADQGSTTVDAPAEDERPSLHDASSDLTGRLQELVHESRSAGSFQRGQLDLQELVLNAGQVVEVPQSDYVSTASGGDQARSSHKKASSTSDVLDKTPPDFDSYALTWKVQVSDLQVAFLSTKLYGTAQFVADDCNISHSIKNATEYTDAVASNAALYLMSHEVDLQNPVCWLDKGPAGYSLPDVDQQVNPIRLCVQPCKLQFRSQAAHVKSDHETTDTKNSPVQYMHMKIDLKSAHIQTSSYEYDVLTDVISHLMISPLPQVPTMARHRRHTPVDSDPALCALRAAMCPTLRAMWGRQRLLAALNSCTPALGYLPRDSGLLHSKPAVAPAPDLSFDVHNPSGGAPVSPASESGGAPCSHLRASSVSAATPQVPFKGVLSRSSMHLNHGIARRSPGRSDLQSHSQTNASGLHASVAALAPPPQPSAATDAAFCPLRTSVETMAAAQVQPHRAAHSAHASISAPAAHAETSAQLDAATTPSPSAPPLVAAGAVPHAWGGSRSTAASPEHPPPVGGGHRKSSSMGCRGFTAPSGDMHVHHLSGLSAGPIAGASSLSQSPVRGAAALATTLETSPTQDPSGRDRLSGRSRPPSPLKAGLRHRETLDTVALSTPSLLTMNSQLSLPLDVDRMGDQAQLVGNEDAELNSKHRQIQLQLQVNQIKDYLNKGDAEVFSSCIVPFLRADRYLQSGDYCEDTLAVMLHTCLINWLDNDITTQEKVVESLEEAIDKERLVLEEALIRKRRAEDLSHSVQLNLFVQQLSWTLHKPDSLPLVSVEGTDISFSRTHHRDRTGYCKAQIRDLSVKDLTATLNISKQLPKGMLLSKLKDTAWRKEGFLLVNVIRGRPTLDEVVYNHIDIKMHPLLVQLDGNMIAALTKFFKVQKTGADVGEKRLDKAMGLSVIARAERQRSKMHARQGSIDEMTYVQPTASMTLQGVGSLQMSSMMSLRTSASVMSSASMHDGDALLQNFLPARNRTDTNSTLQVVPISRAASTMTSLPSMDLQTVHAQSLLESSPLRQQRGSAEARAKVQVEPRVHRYQNVTFSPTIISISLKVDNMKFARCQDKVIRVPDQRYQNMQNARPATLMSRYGWDLACSFLRGMLTIGGSSSLRQSSSSDSIKQDKIKMTGILPEETPQLPKAKPKSKLLSGKSVWNKMKKMGGAGVGSSSDEP